jgi:uncharacterized Zn finger protein (UPF0148 family)
MTQAKQSVYCSQCKVTLFELVKESGYVCPTCKKKTKRPYWWESKFIQPQDTNDK